jgi:hypothetical protein
MRCFLCAPKVAAKPAPVAAVAAPATLKQPPAVPEASVEEMPRTPGRTWFRRKTRAQIAASKRDDPHPSLPDELKKLERFGLYKLEWNEKLKKMDKPPFNPRTGFKGNPINPDDRSTYEIAIAALTADKSYAGLGFGLQYSDGYTCMDFDHCVTNGVIEPRVAKIIQEVNSYAEFSPSGDGIHVWTKGYQVPTTDGKEGRKVGNAGMYSGKHYLTLTGKHVPGTPLTIESRDLSAIYARICASEFVPESEKQQSVTREKTEPTAGDPMQYQVVHDGSTNKFTSKTELLLTGTLETVPGGLTLRDDYGNYIDPPYPSQNETDQSLVNLLALRHKGDTDSIDADFRTSALYRDKWDRQDYRDATMQKGIDFYRRQAAEIEKRAAQCGLVFSRPAVIGEHPGKEHLDYVMGAVPGQWDGICPFGDISLIGSSSGGGKSSFIYEMLDKQRRKEDVFGHATFGLNFLILAYDRGELAYKRMMKRLGLEGREKDFPTEFLSATSNDPHDIAQDIIAKIEKREILPQIVFIEGGDIASSDPSKSGPTKQFLTRLQAIAKYYHLAIIMSVGVPKQKKDEGYVAQRDHIFGSSFWGRMAETMMVIHYRKGDDTDSRRTMYILLRNGPAEKHNLIFNSEGRLVIDLNPDYEEETKEEKWFRAQGPNWFNLRTMMDGLRISRVTAFRACREACEAGFIRKKPGPRQGPGAGAQEYQWIDPDHFILPAVPEGIPASTVNTEKDDPETGEKEEW